MQILIDNVKTRLNIGGKDHLVDPDLMKHFREYMSIDVPGSFFVRKRMKFKQWDGKRYFLTPGGSMATGFLPAFLKYVEQEYPDLKVEIIDQRPYLPKFKPEFVAKIGSIEINEQYIHQKNVIEAYNHYLTFRGQKIYFPRGTADAATNAGKTAIIAGLRLNLDKPEDMLIIIHKKTVYRQLLKYFQEIFGEIGQINDRHYDIKPVTLAMINTLSRRIDNIDVKNDIANFNILAVDEAHRAGSDMYAKTLAYCPAPVRMFVSGTAFDSDNIINNMIVVGLSGSKLINISKRYLMDRGVSTPVKIKMHLCNTILRYPALEVDDCKTRLVKESIERASFIYKIVADRLVMGPILIAVEEIRHGEFLYNFAHGWSKNFTIELTHSKDPHLFEKIEDFTAGNINVLIATGVLKEGVNMPRIATIIMAAGGQSKVYIKQWMGRGERLFEGKEEVEFHDFFDIGRYVQKHSLKRIKIYNDENLEVSYDFDLKDTRRMSSVVIK